MKERIAECINLLGEFCGKRDVPDLTAAELKKKYQIEQADIMVLFGGSIMCGGDVLAKAMKQNIAKKYMIVGGAGHTTETLRIKMHAEFPYLETADLSEAELFEAYLENRYGLHADFLECHSTNCGNNITFMLDLPEKTMFLSDLLFCLRTLPCSTEWKPDSENMLRMQKSSILPHTRQR